jgi:hypothetical protein
LGQQGSPPQQHHQQNWDLNAFGEQVGNNNHLDLDLNIGAMDEEDEEEMNEFLNLIEDINEQAAQVENADEQQVVVIDLNAPANLGYVSTPKSALSSPRLPKDLDSLVDVPIVLALQAPPVNFGVEEIQPQELLAGIDSGENNVQETGQSSSRVTCSASDLQVGMALLT